MTDTPADSGADTAARDYRQTLFLPDTEFPMRAGLPKAEPAWLERWDLLELLETGWSKRQILHATDRGIFRSLAEPA